MERRPWSRPLGIGVLLLCVLAATCSWAQAGPAQKKDKAEERKQLAAEWKQIMKNHPRFAKAMLAQQTVLMANDSPRVRMDICELIRKGLLVLFQDYWDKNCSEHPYVEVGGVLGCLTENRDPAGCFNVNHENEWFEDPRKPWPPPKPPDPHAVR